MSFTVSVPASMGQIHVGRLATISRLARHRVGEVRATFCAPGRNRTYDLHIRLMQLDAWSGAISASGMLSGRRAATLELAEVQILPQVHLSRHDGRS